MIWLIIICLLVVGSTAGIICNSVNYFSQLYAPSGIIAIISIAVTAMLFIGGFFATLSAPTEAERSLLCKMRKMETGKPDKNFGTEERINDFNKELYNSKINRASVFGFVFPARVDKIQFILEKDCR